MMRGAVDYQGSYRWAIGHKQHCSRGGVHDNNLFFFWKKPLFRKGSHVPASLSLFIVDVGLNGKIMHARQWLAQPL